jgi:hypothetical protein
MLWDAAKAGDKAVLRQCLVASTPNDLNFEKYEDGHEDVSQIGVFF